MKYNYFLNCNSYKTVVLYVEVLLKNSAHSINRFSIKVLSLIKFYDYNLRCDSIPINVNIKFRNVNVVLFNINDRKMFIKYHWVNSSNEFGLNCLRMRQVNFPDLSQNDTGKFA